MRAEAVLSLNVDAPFSKNTRAPLTGGADLPSLLNVNVNYIYISPRNRRYPPCPEAAFLRERMDGACERINDSGNRL